MKNLLASGKAHNKLWLLIITVLLVAGCQDQAPGIPGPPVANLEEDLDPGYKFQHYRCEDPNNITLVAQTVTNNANPPRTFMRYVDNLTEMPVVCAHPGDNLSISLTNQLPELSYDEVASFEPTILGNNQGCANADECDILVSHASLTNLHTHGVHVGPSGNKDNVMLTIPPNKHMNYQIPIVPEHAPGTHWYHAHLHGATALQVQAGMAGPLVVLPDDDYSNDLTPDIFRPFTHDFVLLKTNGNGYNADAQAEISKKKTKMTRDEKLAHLRDEMERVSGAKISQSALKSLKDKALDAMVNQLADARSHVTYHINGKSNLAFKKDSAHKRNSVHKNNSIVINVGDVARIRFINAGNRKSDEVTLTMQSPDEEPVDLWLAAVDGINLTQIANENGPFLAYGTDLTLNVSPGNRADLYVQFNTVGTYNLQGEGMSVEFYVEEPFADYFPALEAYDRQQFADILNQRLQYLWANVPAYANGYLQQPALDQQIVQQRNIIMEYFGNENPLITERFGINARTWNKGDWLGKQPQDCAPNNNNCKPFVYANDSTWEQWDIGQSGDSSGHPFHIHVSPFWVNNICLENNKK